MGTENIKSQKKLHLDNKENNISNDTYSESIYNNNPSHKKKKNSNIQKLF